MKKEYFTDLNYTLSNEDTHIEFGLLPNHCPRVFSIAGSGARCLPLIAKNPEILDVIDMSEAQNYLTELRYQATKVLSYQEWLFLLGYRGALQGCSEEGDSRVDLFNKIELSAAAKEYWLTRQSGWQKNGFILLGKWEKHFQKLGAIFRDYLKFDFTPIFKAQNLADQIELYEKYWPHLRWKAFMRVAASEYVFNNFLYKGHFSGQSKNRTEQRPPYQFVTEEFARIFKTQLVRKNYFMQILFLGEIRYEEGLPLEAHESIFEKVKKSKTKVNYLVGNLLDYLPQQAYGFISLSDTISYLPEKQAQQILQKLHLSTAADSKIVIRSFMRAPAKIDLKGWHEMKERSTWAEQTDGTGVYNFHIFSKD